MRRDGTFDDSAGSSSWHRLRRDRHPGGCRASRTICPWTRATSTWRSRDDAHRQARQRRQFSGDSARLARVGDRLRRRGGAAARAGGVRRRERQLAAALRRAMLEGWSWPRRASRRDAVPADGGDVARVDPGGAGAADGRAAGGGRLRSWCGPGRRCCSARSCRTPTCSRDRRGSAGPSRRRPAGVGPAGATLRSALALRRRRAHIEPAARRAGDVRGPQHDAAGLPGGRELPPPLRRLARVGTGRGYTKYLLDIEAQDPPASSRRSRYRPRASRSTRTPRSATPATSSVRRTRWNGSGRASTGRCSRPRTTSGGCATAAPTRPSARPSWRETIEGYERPPLDDARLAELDEYVVRRRAELGD